MVMGTIAQAEHGLYGDKEMTVNPLAEPLGDSLDKAVAKLPENVYEEHSQADTDRLNSNEDATIPQATKPGNFFVSQDGRLLRRLEDVNGRPTSIPVEMKEGTAQRVKGMIPLRDALNRQIKLEQSPDAKESDIEVNRKVLNTLYDNFVKRFGFLNSPSNRRAFYEDNRVSGCWGWNRITPGAFRRRRPRGTGFASQTQRQESGHFHQEGERAVSGSQQCGHG